MIILGSAASAESGKKEDKTERSAGRQSGDMEVSRALEDIVCASEMARLRDRMETLAAQSGIIPQPEKRKYF